MATMAISQWRICWTSNLAFYGLVGLSVLGVRAMGIHGPQNFAEAAKLMGEYAMSQANLSNFSRIISNNLTIMIAPVGLAALSSFYRRKPRDPRPSPKTEFKIIFLWIPLGLFLRNTTYLAYGTISPFEVMGLQDYLVLLAGIVAPHGLLEFGVLSWWFGYLLSFFLRHRNNYQGGNIFQIFLDDVQRQNLLLKIIFLVLLASYIEAYLTTGIAARLFTAFFG